MIFSLIVEISSESFKTHHKSFWHESSIWNNVQLRDRTKPKTKLKIRLFDDFSSTFSATFLRLIIICYFRNSSWNCDFSLFLIAFNIISVFFCWGSVVSALATNCLLTVNWFSTPKKVKTKFFTLRRNQKSNFTSDRCEGLTENEIFTCGMWSSSCVGNINVLVVVRQRRYDTVVPLFVWLY